MLYRRLRAVSEQMGITLKQTTHSPVLHAALDFATGVYNPDGKMLEQADYLPLLAFSLQPACERIRSEFAELSPGDVFIHNDVFSGGNQLADVGIYRPVFVEGTLVAWVATKGHQADIGGAEAAAYNPMAREIWQEGLRIPPVRLYERGQLREDVWRLIMSNVRFPIVGDDIMAQIGATRVGERAIQRLVRSYGTETFFRVITELVDATEAIVRAEIVKIPDGTYLGQSVARDDGIDPNAELRFAVSVTVQGDNISFDFSGTDSQARGFTNAAIAATSAATLMTFLLLIKPDVPRNYGMLRPIRIEAPEGTLVNASYPAATYYGNMLGEQIGEAIIRSLAEAMPSDVTAGWARELAFRITGTRPDDGSKFHDVFFFAAKGGTGATDGFDGHDHGGFYVSLGTVADTDYEVLELQSPVLLNKHEYAPDSGGVGKWRGGVGTETVLTFEESGGDGIVGALLGDGTWLGAFGLFGGAPVCRMKLP